MSLYFYCNMTHILYNFSSESNLLLECKPEVLKTNFAHQKITLQCQVHEHDFIDFIDFLLSLTKSILRDCEALFKEQWHSYSVVCKGKIPKLTSFGYLQINDCTCFNTNTALPSPMLGKLVFNILPLPSHFCHSLRARCVPVLDICSEIWLIF